MNIYKKLTQICLLFIVCFATPVTSQDLGLSDEELLQFEQLEKQLAQASQEIEQAVAQMSPEEQAEFHKAVEEMTKMFEGMSDDEFEQFLGQIMDEDFDETLFEEQLLGNVAQEDFQPALQEIEPAVSLEEFKDILTILENISKQINLFLVKISSSPDLPGKLVWWRQQEKIKNWPAEMSWGALRSQLELFSHTVILLQQLDTNTKKAKYLSFLMEDLTLQENLKNLNTKLSFAVAKIEIPEFGLEKLTPVTKSFVQNTMNALTEVLFVLQLPAAFTAIEEKFGPEAKKIKESIEKQIQDASRSASRSLQPGKSVDVTEVFDERFTNSYSPISYDTGSYGRQYSSSPNVPTSSAKSLPEEKTPSKKGSPSGSGSSGKSPKEKGAEVDPEKKSDEDAQELERLKQFAKEKALEDKVAEQTIQRIIETINKIKKILETDSTLKDLKKVVQTKQTSGSDLQKIMTTVSESFSSLNKQTKELMDEIEALSMHIKSFKNKDQQEYYKKALISHTTQQVKSITAFVDTVNGIKYEQNKKTISPALRWLLFKDMNVKESVMQNKTTPEFVKQFPENCLISLIDISKNFYKLVEKIKNPEKDVAFVVPAQDCEILAEEAPVLAPAPGTQADLMKEKEEEVAIEEEEAVPAL